TDRVHGRCSWSHVRAPGCRGAGDESRRQVLNFQQNLCARIETRNAVLSASGRAESFERALSVARLLLVQGADPETIAAALISQAIPERDLDMEAVQSAFGPELAALIRGVARAGRIESLEMRGVDLEQVRKMLLAIAEDVRVVLIKLAERVAYLRSLTRADEAVRQ